MNSTHQNFHPRLKASTTQYYRRSSLDSFQKNNKHSSSIIKQQAQNFRRTSCTSFDKKYIKSKEQLPQIKYEKQMDNNIYFNPKTRTNFFKNLIDSYFDNKQDKSKSYLNQQNYERKSHIFRKSVLNSKAKVNQELNSFIMNNNEGSSKGNQAKINQNKEFSTSLENFNAKQQKRVFRSKRYKHQSEDPSSLESKLGGSSKSKQIKKQSQSHYYNYPEDNKQKQFQPMSSVPPAEYSFLPKITQAVDDGQEDAVRLSQKILPNDEIHSFLRTQNSFKTLEQRKYLVYENAVLRLYQALQNDKKYRIKQFKNKIFFDRHKRACQMGVQNFWKPYKFHQISLMIPFIFPLKDLLYKLSPHPTSPQYFYLTPKPLYTRLISNNCQQLFLLFKQLIKDLNKLGNRVINNKINLSNIFYVNGKFCIGEWQYSAFKQENKIQGNHFQSRVQPILKCEKQWLVSPEYLSPQILDSIENIQKPFNLWEYENAPDIYSLGVSFLQIITQVPVWIQYRTIVKGKLMKPRQGCISTNNRSIARILEKQNNLIPKMTQILQRQIPQTQKNPRFFNILLRMIQPQPSKRIQLHQIIKSFQ